jgi:hypothetical protein
MPGVYPTSACPANGAKRPAGTRVALPGTFCGTEVPRFLHGPSELGPYKTLGSVREHLPHGSDVAIIHLGDLLQLTHALGGFCAEQVAFPGMHAQDLSVSGDLKALLSAAMRLQLLLRLH